MAIDSGELRRSGPKMTILPANGDMSSSSYLVYSTTTEMGTIPQVLIDQLKNIEPQATFTGNPPKVTSSTGKVYFAKIGSLADQDQYTGEVESLTAIERAAPGLAPHVFSSGTDPGGKPYLISEFKTLSRMTDTAGEVLAQRLATEMHMHVSTNGFGFHVPTYCGATRLKNGWFDTWESCFSSMLDDLVQNLAKKGVYRDLCEQVGEVRARVIPKLLGPLEIEPVLLHGDLWSGNVGVETRTSQPIIFDPSSFYGHNEADLAIAKIFGGFPSNFFTTYHAHHPRTEPQEEYELREDLYELFHYLNHTVLFEGSYAEAAQRKSLKLITTLT